MSRDGVRRSLWFGGGLALLVGFFFACFEKRTFEIPVGYSREARTNPYLALGQLFSRMGHEVRTLDGVGGLDELPGPGSVLFLPTQRRTLTRERQQQLLDWVESGGRLVAVTYTLWDETDRRPDWLLDRFGIQQYMHPEPEPEEAEETGEEAPDPGVLGEVLAGLSPSKIDWDRTEVHWPDLGEPLWVNFDPRFYWVDPLGDAELYLTGEAGTHMIVLRHGAGWLAALTDDWLLRSDHIGDADHAELLLRLVRLHGTDDAPVWIVPSERWPGLWAQARKHALPVVLAAAALLVTWLWRSSRRFGPLRPPPAPERRSWMEHLEAVAAFDWQHGRGRGLLAAAHSAVLRAIQREHPGWMRLEPVARAAQIARRSGLTPAEAARALDADFHPASEAAFVERVEHLERIRSSL